jgi:hypothetical protein
VSEQLLRAEIGYAGATALLAFMLRLLYLRSAPAVMRQSAPTDSAIAR